jgi:hypothetical protein
MLQSLLIRMLSLDLALVKQLNLLVYSSHENAVTVSLFAFQWGLSGALSIIPSRSLRIWYWYCWS